MIYLNNNEINKAFDALLAFKPSKEPNERKVYFKNMAKWIREHELEIKNALHKDLRKHPTEAYITEIFPILNEIELFISNLSSWLRPKNVANNLVFTGASASLNLEPKGRCLILSPWNYPFQLPLLHLISCVAAGNTAILKPSEFTPHTNNILKKLIIACFQPQHVTLIEGDVAVSSYLLSLPFDHIHFTGSTKVGKIVMEAAAKNLASCTLELGGKSPFIIDDKYNLEKAIQKLILGKFINLGQTCIAPDYVLIPTNRKDEFIKLLKEKLIKSFGVNAQENENLSRIINVSNHQRLVEMLKEARLAGAEVVFGGAYDVNDLFIEPTVITNIPNDCQLLQDEIFGPLLPIVTYDTVMDAVQFIKQRTKPLAIYLSSNQNKWIEYFNENTSSGALVINDVMVHIMHPNLPFGGVNHSGLGQSTGYFGLKDFSHQKPILKANPIISPTAAMGFPYKENIEKLLGVLT